MHCGICKRMAHLFEFLRLTTQTTMQNMRTAVNTATVIAIATPTIMPSVTACGVGKIVYNNYDELLIKLHTHLMIYWFICSYHCISCHDHTPDNTGSLKGTAAVKLTA